MASRLFPLAAERFVAGTLVWTSGVFRVVLLPAGIQFDFTEEYLDAIPAGARIVVSADIADRALAEGWHSGAPVDFGVVSDTREISQAIVFLDTGDESTSLLVAYLGGEGLVGEPFAPLGVRYFLYPDAAAGGFFFLCDITPPVLTAEQTTSPGPVELAWAGSVVSPLRPVLAYLVYVSRNGGAYTLLDLLPPIATSYSDAAVYAHNDTLSYVVAIRVSVPNSPGDPQYVDAISNSAEVEWHNQVLIAPTLSASQMSVAGPISVAWTEAVASEPIVSYALWRDINGGGFSLITSLAPDELAFEDTFAFSHGDVISYYVIVHTAEAAAQSNTSTVPFYEQFTVTWNPSDKSANITLTAFDMTAASSSATQSMVRATLGRTTGKYYFEVQADTVGTPSLLAYFIGITDGSVATDQYVGSTSSSMSVRSYGGVASSGGSQGSLSFAAGDVVSFAVDLDHGYVWIAVNGVWSPALPGVGVGYQYASIGSTMFPAVSFGLAALQRASARFTAGRFTYAPPTGFLPWEET